MYTIWKAPLLTSYVLTLLMRLAAATEKLVVLTADGRIIVGVLLGYDQVQNLILNEAYERLYSADADMEEEALGLFLVRGDNICLVGECNDDEDNKANPENEGGGGGDSSGTSTNQRPPFPIPPIQQQQF